LVLIDQVKATIVYPATNISIGNRTANTIGVYSSTGTGAILPAVSTTEAGLMPATDKVKLNGITTGATANSTDAQLRDRTTHTGVQAIATVTGLQIALDGKQNNLGFTPYNATNPSGFTANSTDAQLRDRTTHTGVQAIATVTGLQTALDGKQNNLGFTPYNATNPNGFTANSTDAQLRDRTNHTGVQAIATVTGLQSALDSKQATGDYATNTTVTNGLNTKINNSEKAVANGVATLGADGKVPNNQIPALAISETFEVTTQAAMLALTGVDQGDVAVRSDVSKAFILRQLPSTTLANWVELLTPASTVTSVAGKVGAVVLNNGDVGLGNVPNISFSGSNNGDNATNTQYSGLATSKENTITAGTTSQYFRGDKTFQELNKVAVGLANAENTSDLNKVVSNPTQTALNLKANLAAPTFTGTVTAPTFVGALNGNASTATNAAKWGNNFFVGVEGGNPNYLLGAYPNGEAKYVPQSSARTFLGLGSNAYNSTAFLPLTGGTISGDLTVGGVTRLGVQSSYSTYINGGLLMKDYGNNAVTSGRLYYQDDLWNFRGGGEGELDGSASTEINVNSGGGFKRVLHAGNYNSYALPLSGGTVTGQLTVAQFNTTSSNSNTISSDLTIGYGGVYQGVRFAVQGDGKFSGTVTATSFFQSSDIRLKNIIKRDGDVIYYTWKDKRDTKSHIGYIAQKVRAKNPDQVNKDDEGYLSVNYIEILVEKIRNLEKEIELLKAK
jgi:hypothetical protein